jgi:hypothetical protein
VRVADGVPRWFGVRGVVTRRPLAIERRQATAPLGALDCGEGPEPSDCRDAWMDELIAVGMREEETLGRSDTTYFRLRDVEQRSGTASRSGRKTEIIS